MAKFNVHVSQNKKQTFFIASITNEKKEVIKEFYEPIGALGAKTHQKILNRTCVDWIQNDYQPPADFIQTTSENISGANI
jgi:hypothetical protein